MNRVVHDKTMLLSLLVVCAIACFNVLPNAKAVVPGPDGGYPNFTTAEGQNALLSLTTGAGNTGVGWFSLRSVTTGSYNTGVGAGTLVLNNADSNTAVGTAALLLNTTGNANTAVGANALLHNNADGNTAIGYSALFSNTTGDNNTGNGVEALQGNTTGRNNTANGAAALENNTTGDRNTGNGSFALFNNTTGHDNTANGAGALENNTASNNTASGSGALFANFTGSNNVAVGASALQNNSESNNVAVGFDALSNKTTGVGNIALGTEAGVNLQSGNDNIYIKSQGPGSPGNESNAIRIGFGFEQSTFIAGISGVTVADGASVFIKSDGQLGTMTSSARFKHDIKPMGDASETLLALKPVTFRYKKEIDAEQTPQFGLVAEDVEEVNPDLVLRDANGKVNTVRYEAVNAMLLNEFLKARRQIDAQQKQIDTLTAGLQKVSAQLELGKSARRSVANDR